MNLICKLIRYYVQLVNITTYIECCPPRKPNNTCHKHGSNVPDQDLPFRDFGPVVQASGTQPAMMHYAGL